MATFDELWSAIVPSAVPVAQLQPAQLHREVGWVRVLKARVPAFDALEPGDVAIVPAQALAVVAPTSPEADQLADGLAAAGCAGVLLVEGDRPDPVADAVAAAITARGVPTLRAGRLDPSQLERSAIGVLLNRRAELEHQAGLLEASLEEVALGSGDVEAVIAAVGGFLGRAVVLEGRRGELIAAHAPDGAPGAAAAVAAYLAGSRSAALRLPIPTGRLVLLGENPATELERVVGPRVGRLLALELARTEAVRRAADVARRTDILPADGPPWAMLVARQVPSGGDVSIEAREEIRSRLRAIAPARRMALRGDAESLELRIVIAVRSDPSDGDGTHPSPPQSEADAMAIAARISGLLGRPIAVSRVFREPAGRPAAEAEARAALDAIEALPEPPAVARADRLAGYRLLGSLQNLPDGARHAESMLAPLLSGSPAARRERLATLRAVLDQPGFNEAAAALGVHRNTLAYRLRRIEQMTGWRLADPELRLPLAIALRLVQVDP